MGFVERKCSTKIEIQIVFKDPNEIDFESILNPSKLKTLFEKAPCSLRKIIQSKQEIIGLIYWLHFKLFEH